jgi:hypothetical protein
MIRAVSLAAVAAALALAAPARAAPARKGASAAPAAAAFLGLRPAANADFGPTRLEALPDAQRLRAVAESVLAATTGSAVLGHDELRAALGKGYLVDVLECGGTAACLARVAAALRRQGTATAYAGDVFASPEGYRVRVRRLDLASGRMVAETTFTLPRAEAETLAAWRAALAPLVARTGSIAIVTNQPDAQCTLDGAPCERAADGTLANVPEGEHVIELAKDGFRRATRTVTVRAGEQQRVALSLEDLPAQVVKAPDPAARLPTFAEPTEETQVTPYGSARLALVSDDVNAGDREDPSVPPDVRPGTWTFSALPRPIVLGLAVQAPRAEAGWQVRGAVSLAWVRDEVPEVDAAYAEVLDEEAGWRVMLGLGPSVVSGLTAGTLTLPEGFGDLAPGFAGVTASRSFGGLLLEGFVGKQKGQLSPEPEGGAALSVPFVAGHVAWVSPHVKGTLYGDEYPLTVGVSGAYGEERVGGDDEQAWAADLGLAEPRREGVPAWVASAELFVPLGDRGSFAGEAWLGEDVQLFEGALWQVPRVDGPTGEHRALRSAGGWLQLAVRLAARWEALAVVGTDEVLQGNGFGLAPLDAPAVRRNRLAALVLTWRVPHLAVGAQVQALRTEYVDPALGRPRLLGAAATAQLSF